MRSEILKKLGAPLQKLPTTEGEVVYVLVQIRKLLEQNSPGERFVDLKFFCDWSLHVELKGSRARKVAERLVNHANPDPNTTSHDHHLHSEFHEIFSFDRFRTQLADLCRSVDLPQVWTPTAQSWRQCLMLYTNVVVDCPLTIIPPRDSSKGIRKAVLRASQLGDVVKAGGGIDYFPFSFRWTITADDARIVNICINAS